MSVFHTQAANHGVRVTISRQQPPHQASSARLSAHVLGERRPTSQWDRTRITSARPRGSAANMKMLLCITILARQSEQSSTYKHSQKATYIASSVPMLRLSFRQAGGSERFLSFRQRQSLSVAVSECVTVTREEQNESAVCARVAWQGNGRPQHCCTVVWLITSSATSPLPILLPFVRASNFS